MVEWFKAPVLKTGMLFTTSWVRIPFYLIITKIMKYIKKFNSILFLRKGLVKESGRNKDGKITTRHHGGGHKKAFRTLD